jgi:hypothetical protein
VSSRGHDFAFELNWDGRTHDLKEHAHTAGIVEAVQYSKLLGKWARQKANFATDLEVFQEAKKTVRID